MCFPLKIMIYESQEYNENKFRTVPRILWNYQNLIFYNGQEKRKKYRFSLNTFPKPSHLTSNYMKYAIKGNVITWVTNSQSFSFRQLNANFGFLKKNLLTRCNETVWTNSVQIWIAFMWLLSSYGYLNKIQMSCKL
jgi:hypothetical protein